MRKYKKSNRRLLKIMLALIIIFLLLFFCAYSFFEKRLSKIIYDMSANTVKSKAGIIISSAIYDEIDKLDITYDKLVSFEKDNGGQITALKTDIIEINKLKTTLSVRILTALSCMDTAELDIPIGTVIGSELLVGKGPAIRVNVVPVGTVETEIINEITSAGINQSRHQIMMKINAEMTIITSLTNLTTEVETYICIAETVIVGSVPQSYTNIDTSEEVFDKYNDFIM